MQHSDVTRKFSSNLNSKIIDWGMKRNIIFSNNTENNVNHLYDLVKNNENRVDQEDEIVIIDSADYNSAFVHEYLEKNFAEGKKLPVKIRYYQATEEIKKFIKYFHTNVWGMSDEYLAKNPNAKFEIFILYVKDNMLYAKSDDYDIVNQHSIDALFSIFNSENNESK